MFSTVFILKAFITKESRREDEVKNDEINNYIIMYQERLTKFCCNLCGNYNDADDLFQETWLKVIRYYDKYDKSKDFGKWLFKICINTYKNNQMSAFNRHNMIFNSTEEKEIFLSSIPDQQIKNDNYPELLRIIRELPDKYRIVLTLRYFNDYSEKDAADMLGIPVGTVKSRLNKAKKLIKRRFFI